MYSIFIVKKKGRAVRDKAGQVLSCLLSTLKKEPRF